MTAEKKPKLRLKRLDWVFTRSPLYFITMCTADRRPILASTEIHVAFVTFSIAAADRGVLVGRYVMMPDHLHIFAVLDDERVTLSDWIKTLKNALSKTLRSRGVASPHWQKGFFDRVLRSGDSYSEKWHYVRDNPVRAQLVANADNWPFGGELHSLEFHDAR